MPHTFTREPIEVRRYGTSGPTLGLLHGGPGAPGALAGLARALAPEFRVLEPLQRWTEGLPLNVAAHVEDLAQVAPNTATLWLGHSWGAMLALSFAVRYPELVRALVLVGCGTYDDASRSVYRERIDRARVERGMQTHVDALRARLTLCSDAAERERIRSELAGLAADVMTVDAIEPAQYERVDGAGNVDTWNDVLRLQREGVEPAAFASITAPVLMLHGDDDPHPGAQTRDVLRLVLPQLEYVGFARCGHEPWRERHARDAFLSTLQRWLHERAA